MSILNMFGGAPRKEAPEGEDTATGSGAVMEESAVPSSPEVAVENGRVLTPGDLAEEKRLRETPDGWRGQE
jgi:hypothetical protein